MHVALIGDSIRLNAEKYIASNLPPDWKISSPPENCESSKRMLDELDRWVSVNADIIHLNCGLHDIRYDPGKIKPVSNLQQYQLNLECIFGYLSKLNAQIIWATSTPFREAIHNQVKESRRYEKDILLYNYASVNLAKKFGFYINDLYSKIFDTEYSSLLLEDGLHFNQNGNEFIGQLIAESIIGVSQNSGTVNN